MRYSPQQKEETRQKILDAAFRTFCRDGYSATGVDAVMAEAGLTAGAFYRHFKSKEELFGKAIVGRFDERRQFLEEGLEGLSGLAWIEAMINRYLSPEHLAAAEFGCPLPALMPELNRACTSIQEGVQNQLLNWAGAVERAIEAEQREADSPEPDRPAHAKARQQLALSLLSTLIGGMILARTFGVSARADAVLRGARSLAINSARSACSSTDVAF